MTPSTCPACGGPLCGWRTVPSAEPALPGTFQLLRCERCGTAVTSGAMPADLHDSGAYGPRDPRLSGLARPALAAFDRQRLRVLARAIRPPARLLDAGAGRGRFVAAARQAGYDATGLEPSLRGWQAAKAIGVSVVRAGLEHERAFEPSSFDAATVWHVLEHTGNPAQGLHAVHGWLRPGGAVLIGVPNLTSLQASIAGERWYHLDVPRHRTHFTPAGVRALLGRAGFAPLSVDHILLEHNPFGMWQSLVNRLTVHPSYLYNLLKRNVPLHHRDLAVTLGSLPLAPLAALLELGAGVAGRGGTIAVLARRDG